MASAGTRPTARRRARAAKEAARAAARETFTRRAEQVTAAQLFGQDELRPPRVRRKVRQQLRRGTRGSQKQSRKHGDRRADQAERRCRAQLARDAAALAPLFAAAGWELVDLTRRGGGRTLA